MLATATATEATSMKAIVRDTYGSPDVLRLEEIEKPELADDGVLVRVQASSVNRADWYTMLGKPAIARPMLGGVFKPKSRLLGTDFAGTVEAVGKDVTRFSEGDEVFGGRDGAFAEYVCARSLELKPANMTFEQAAAVPIAALTALQGLRDQGRVEAGQHVLVNGASGGVGTFAVQIAKALGANVTAVCSTRNVELVRSLGADRVIDYTSEDFTRSGERYDLMFDVGGSKSWRACRRVLKPQATLVMVGSQTNTPLLGPMGHTVATWAAAIGSSQKAAFFIAKFNLPDLAVLRELLEDGKMKPVVERRYELGETADALRYMGEGHVQGKLVITV